MKSIEHLGEFLEMEIDYDIDYMFTSSDDYLVSFNGIHYYLEGNSLVNGYDNIIVTKEISDYIIEKCLKDLPF